MKKIIFFPILVLAIINISCQDSFTVKNDENIQNLFDEKEISDINSIVEFVDNKMLSKSNEKNIDLAYHTYFESLSKTIKEDSRIPSAFDEKEKYSFLESLDKNTFNDFFRIRTQLTNVRYKDTILTNIDNVKLLEINLSGKFMKYMEKTGETDDFYKKLHESIEIAGDLSPSFATWFPVNHKDFDFNIVKNRLWAAVYLLRMEGHINDKIEYYMNK
jgi:hypothetical protein